MKKRVIYTIGYTLFQNGQSLDLEKMFSILRSFGVNYLIDVRSIPYSKQYPQSNAEFLKISGTRWGVPYGHIPELGAKASSTQDVFSNASDIFFDNIFPIPKSNRPENTELRSDDEIVDFNKFRHDVIFVEGLMRIKKAYDQNLTLSLMCSEKKPFECHRFFLISRAIDYMFGDSIEVRHIVQNQDGDITTITNKEIDAQLKELILKKNEVIKLDIFSATLSAPAAIEKYYGDTIEEKIKDFCDRYWNILHGWKKYNVASNNIKEEYD